MSRGHNKTGRSKGNSRFAAIPHEVLDSPGYSSTRPAARAVLIELVKLHNGSNNGRLALSVRRIQERCNMSKDTAAKALQELEDAGLIEMVTKGSFRQKNRHASEYRLLWNQCDVTNALPRSNYRAARNTHHKPDKPTGIIYVSDQKDSGGGKKQRDDPVTSTAEMALSDGRDRAVQH